MDNKAIARITFTIAAPTSPQHAKRRVYCVKLVGIPHHTVSNYNLICFYLFIVLLLFALLFF